MKASETRYLIFVLLAYQESVSANCCLRSSECDYSQTCIASFKCVRSFTPSTTRKQPSTLPNLHISNSAPSETRQRLACFIGSCTCGLNQTSNVDNRAPELTPSTDGPPTNDTSSFDMAALGGVTHGRDP